MKKLLVLLLTLVLCFGMAACGADDDKADKGSENGTTTKTEEPEVKKIDKSVDAVARELELGESTEAPYQRIGAESGKKYKDGTVELYLFDEASDEYKAIAGGSGAIQAAAANSGMIILTDDTALADEFKKIKFK